MALPRRVEPPAAVTAPPAPVEVARRIGKRAFWMLQVPFVALPLLAGIDKFFNLVYPWRDYLAPDVSDLLGLSPRSIMQAVGVIEILVALLVAFRPSVGGWLLAAWLWATALNLVILPARYDIVLRDLALSLGAIALARLATHRRLIS
jgi:hypothetical protein